MSKSLLIFTTLTLFLIVNLSPIPVSSDDNELETASYSYTVQLVSEKCEYSPEQTWPADEIPHFIINRTLCSGGGPCSYRCSSPVQLGAEDLNQERVIRDIGSLLDIDATNTEDGYREIHTTFIDTNIICHDQSVVRLSQVLTPSTYSIGNDTLFSVITETVGLEPLPTHTPTPNPGQIEGYVWHDVNEDGIRDEDEPGIVDVSIELFSDCNTSHGHDAEIDFRRVQHRTSSDNQGFYQFKEIVRELPSNIHFYALQFDDRFTYTTRNQGSNDMRDSDVINTCSPNDYEELPCVVGRTNGFTMPLTGTLHGLDAGLLSTPTMTPTLTATPSPTHTPTSTPTPAPTPTPNRILIDIYLPIIAQ